ncbi:MAG: hypothetical protein ABEK04_01020 [Candidatus Nanohalobium sp.]
MSDAGNIGLDVKRDVNEIADEIVGRRNEKIAKDIDYPHSIRAHVYSSEQDPLYAFNKAFSDSTIMMTPDPESSGSVDGFRQLMDYTWEQEDRGTDLEALAPEQCEHVPVLRNATQLLAENGYSAEVEIEGTYIEDNIEEAIDAVESNGAKVELWMNDGPQGEEVIGDGLYTKARYHPGSQQLEPEVNVATENADYETAEEVQNDLERILEKEGLLI